jgi:hypothetical protein
MYLMVCKCLKKKKKVNKESAFAKIFGIFKILHVKSLLLYQI